MKHPIFNYKNFSAVLWLNQDDIKYFTVMMPTCNIYLKNGKRIKVHAEEFEREMNLSREMKAIKQESSFFLSDEGDKYKVYSSSSGQTYWLELERENIKCTCPDYQNLVEVGLEGKVMCKHGHYLLNYYQTPIDSNDYLEMWRETELVKEYGHLCEINTDYSQVPF